MGEFSARDSALMARAIRLAEKGRFSTRPNPAVGCVIARDGDIVGEGYHARAGEPHAEVIALRAAGERARGATAYVTLEPCAVEGRTPPCTDALLDAGVAEVVFAASDPSPAACGQGPERLRAAGVVVRHGLMAAAAEQLNRGFFSRVTRGRPFLCLKLAASLDGAIAMASGESQWITGAAARADVQRLRAASGAILTGVGTIVADDPSLTVRDARYPIPAQPLRVIADSSLACPPGAALFGLPGETLVVTAGALDDGERDCVALPGADGRVDLAALLAMLAARHINDVLAECGPTLAGALLDAGLVDELVIYQSPHIMGSETRRMAVTPAWQRLADRRALVVTDRRRFGPDMRITARISD